MTEYRLELFRISGQKRPRRTLIAAQTVSGRSKRTRHGEENLGIELGSELRRALEFGAFYDRIPNTKVKLVRSTPRRLGGSPDTFVDALRTQELWLEISNTLADVRFLLGQARAYKAQEPPRNPGNYGSEQLRYYAHFTKMYNLNLAVFGLVKIQDLAVRLLHENFGGRLINVDEGDPDWEKELTLKKARSGLKERLKFGELGKREYDSIIKALQRPAQSRHRVAVVAYRNRYTHRLRPSVDYPELFAHLQDRGKPIINAAGQVVGKQWAIGGRPTKAEFQFVELYDALLDYLKHVIEMLTALKKMKRFV